MLICGVEIKFKCSKYNECNLYYLSKPEEICVCCIHFEPIDMSTVIEQIEEHKRKFGKDTIQELKILYFYKGKANAGHWEDPTNLT